MATTSHRVILIILQRVVIRVGGGVADGADTLVLSTLLSPPGSQLGGLFLIQSRCHGLGRERQHEGNSGDLREEEVRGRMPQ